MTNYRSALAVPLLALAALGAGPACADDQSAAARPAVAQAAPASAAKPAAAKPAAQAAPAPAAPAASSAPAGARRFVQRPGSGSLTFSFMQAGAENHGAFRQFATELAYDEHNPAAGALRVTVQVASLDTQDKDRDSTLATAELLDTQKFTTATYVATSFGKRAGGGLEALGKLTLRGATKDLRLPLDLKRTADGYELSGAATIKRLDFGVGQGEWESTEWVGNDVKIAYKVALVEAGGVTAPPPPR